MNTIEPPAASRERSDQPLGTLGLSVRVVTVSILAGVALGLSAVLSPLATAFAIGAPFLVGRAFPGISGRERRWLATAIVFAVVARVLFLAALFLWHQHTGVGQFGAIVPDEMYAKQRSLWIRNVWLGFPIPQLYFWIAFGPDAYGWTIYHYIAAFLQVVVGPAPYGLHFLSLILWLEGAILLHRLVRQSFGRIPALETFIVLLLMPTLFIWSVAIMKEALQFFLGAVLFFALTSVIRGQGRAARLTAALAFLAALGLSGVTRAGALEIAVAGMGLGLIMMLLVSRPIVCASIAAAVALAGLYGSTQTSVGARVLGELRHAGVVHLGHARSAGHGYKLLDSRFYLERTDLNDPNSPLTMTVPEVSRFVVRAMGAFVLAPLPWNVTSRSELAYLAPHMIWYLLFVLALVGVPAAYRRDPLLTCLLCGYVAVGAAAIALYSGNVGTLARHRDTLVPFIAGLSGVGASLLVAGSAAISTLGLADRRVGAEQPA